MKIFIALAMLCLFVCPNKLYSQELTQTLRGKVVDQVSQNPIEGASVIVLGSDPVLGAVTDRQGEFKIAQVPLGTQALQVSFMGYEKVVLSQIQVNSGKETVLAVALKEDISEISEFVVTASQKEKTVNDMIAVSGRTFSVEETRKFAAAVNDPGRMAISFSGVVSTDDGNNNISIRGNNPNGLLWRMEGIEIPNPNHFVNPGSSGGGISILSSQLLANSDFITGAFPAEYGNALSGVFDLSLRKGNNEQREFTVQAGFLGTDVAVEGPFSPNYKGSYLVNYRYSTLSLLSKIGVPLGDYVTNFQDLSFNFYLPAGDKNSFSIFGFGGLSDQKSDAKLDSLQWESDDERYSSTFFSNTGAAGVKHVYLLHSNHVLQNTVLLSGTELGDNYHRLDEEYVPEERYFEKFGNSKLTVSSVLNSKLSARSSLRSGIYWNKLYYQLHEKSYEEELGGLETKINSNGNTETLQLFSQWNYRVTERLTVNLGMHYLRLNLNQSQSLEPRASVSYALDERQSLSFGYGLHSQIQPLGTYFAEQIVGGQVSLPNHDLDLSKSHQMVLGYDRSINPYLRVKLETYYQHLYQIPIKPGVDQTYSIINQKWSFMTDPLISDGKGKNYGLEMSLEQFTNQGIYFLFSGSLYNSLYQTEESKWRNTRFNGNFNLTLTGGKEFEWEKGRSFGVNIRAIYSGGMRVTPIDLEASIQKGETVWIEEKAFEEQNPNYFRADLRFSLKRNKAKSTRTWALDIQNASNRKNVYGSYFEPMSGEIKTSYLSPLIPILSYRIEF